MGGIVSNSTQLSTPPFRFPHRSSITPYATIRLMIHYWWFARGSVPCYGVLMSGHPSVSNPTCPTMPALPWTNSPWTSRTRHDSAAQRPSVYATETDKCRLLLMRVRSIKGPGSRVELVLLLLPMLVAARSLPRDDTHARLQCAVWMGTEGGVSGWARNVRLRWRGIPSSFPLASFSAHVLGAIGWQYHYVICLCCLLV